MGRPASKDIQRNAYPLDPDINPWDPQPNENPEVYERFRAYLNDEKRIQKDHRLNPAEPQRWSWGYRAYQYDLYMARVDEQDMIRYRRTMNDRHRAAARGAQFKIVQWLNNLEPTDLTPFQAARWYELAVRVEREAAGANLRDRGTYGGDDLPADDAPDPAEADRQQTTGKTLAEMLDAGDDIATEVARAIHRLESQS